MSLALNFGCGSLQ